MSQADQAETEIREQIDDDILADAEQTDGLDTSGVIQSVAEKRSSYQTSTQARFAQAALERQIDAADGETLKGILMGSRDRYGANWPRRYSLVRSDGSHMEVSSWESTLPGPDGHDVDLAPGSIVALNCSYTEEYDDYTAERVERLSPLDKSELVDKLESVATRPSDVSRSDEYEIVAVQGEIAYLDSQTIFKDGSPNGEGPVLMEDGHEPPQRQPHFEVALRDDNGTRVRGHLERQNVGQPYVDLPEIDMLLEDAMDAGGPEAQASFLQAALEGLEVTIIGNVNSVNTDRDDEGNKRTYVEIAATAIVDMDAGAPDGAPEPESESEPEPEPEPEDEPEGDDDDDDEDADADAEPANDAQADAAEVASDIETAANLQGADPAALTVADVKDMAPALAEDHPDEVLQHAVRSLSSDSEATEDDGSDDSASGMDALEACRSDGLYKCPADGCLVQVGERGAFMTHVEDEHADAPAPEWVSEHA